MIPTLIVLGLLALGVAIVAWATRRPSTRQDVIVEQHTGWNDPITPANVDPVENDPFAHAPAPTTQAVRPEASAPVERTS